MNLDQFVEDKNVRNAWIQETDLDAYVRKSLRMLDSKSQVSTPCLDIGSVEVDEPNRGKGIFTAFLEQFEQAAKKVNRTVYVESILNSRLKVFLLAKGYQLAPNSSDLSPNLFKLPS